MFFVGTRDARGWTQWKEAGRHIKKGSKAFTILAPWQQTNEYPKETNPK
jgi:hypothetical protein